MHSQVPAYFNVLGLNDSVTVEATPDRNGNIDFPPSLVSEIPTSYLDGNCTFNQKNPKPNI